MEKEKCDKFIHIDISEKPKSQSPKKIIPALKVNLLN